MSKHALVIDDNTKNVNILALLLTEQGVTSTLVTNPNLLDEVLVGMGAVDVVFIDLEMPGMNGFDVRKRLKADPRFVHVPLVAYTVHVSEMNVANEAGFDSFLGKPLDSEKFPDQLARILNGEPVWSRGG
ncbi:MAG: response regulator [Anaerolineae bacterium]|jgi:CheY-like chemotaxis protein|nr:response regulator [Anaerolineae bacterium]